MSEAWCELKRMRWAEIEKIDIPSIPYCQNYRVASWPSPKETGVMMFYVYFYFKKESEDVAS